MGWIVRRRRGEPDNDPEEPELELKPVRLALGRRQHDAATRWVAPVLDCDEPIAITALALAFLDYGDESTAVRALTRAVALDYPAAMDYGARLLDKQGMSEQAAGLRARARAIRAQSN